MKEKISGAHLLTVIKTDWQTFLTAKLQIKLHQFHAAFLSINKKKNHVIKRMTFYWRLQFCQNSTPDGFKMFITFSFNTNTQFQNIF